MLKDDLIQVQGLLDSRDEFIVSATVFEFFLDVKPLDCAVHTDKEVSAFADIQRLKENIEFFRCVAVNVREQVMLHIVFLAERLVRKLGIGRNWQHHNAELFIALIVLRVRAILRRANGRKIKRIK